MAVLAILVHRAIGVSLHRREMSGQTVEPTENPFPRTIERAGEPMALVHRETEENNGVGAGREPEQAAPTASSPLAAIPLQNSFLPSKDNQRLHGQKNDEKIQLTEGQETIPGSGQESMDDRDYLDENHPDRRRRVACGTSAMNLRGSAHPSLERENGRAAAEADEGPGDPTPEFAADDSASTGRETPLKEMVDEKLLQASRKEVARVQVIFVIRLFAQLILISVAMTKMKCGHLEFALSWVILFVLSQTWDIASILLDSKLSKGPQ